MQDDYNFYFIQDGKPVEIKRSTELKIKLSKEQKKELREINKHNSGSLTLELVDPYKDFKDKFKAQIKAQIKAKIKGESIK